jgi:single-strand DNA-binding protein
MNRICITGRVGADAETRFLQNGDAVVNVRVAVSGWKKDSDATWLGVVIFGKRGEAVAQYLTKGSRIGVSGRLQVREYEKRDQSGRGTSVEIVADDVTLLGKPEARGDDGGQRREYAPRDAGQRQQQQRRDTRDDFDDGAPPPNDGDIPF